MEQSQCDEPNCASTGYMEKSVVDFVSSEDETLNWVDEHNEMLWMVFPAILDLKEAYTGSRIEPYFTQRPQDYRQFISHLIYAIETPRS